MFQRIKDQSPTIQLFFLFGIIVFGFFLYMTLQSVIVLNAFPGIEEMEPEEIMPRVMNSKNGIAQLLLILQQLLFFLIPGILINYVLKKNNKNIYMFEHNWKAFVSPMMLMIVALFSLFFLLKANELFIDLLPNSDYYVEMDRERSGVVELAANNDSVWLMILNVIGITILPAIGEELIFRGFLIRNFYQNSGNMYFAIFGSSFLFALIHFQPMKIIPMFVLGLLLALFYVHTRNILVPIACHFLNNIVSLISLKYNIMEYSENIYVSALAAAYLMFRIYFYVRGLRGKRSE